MECFIPSTTCCFEDEQEVTTMKNLTPKRERKGRGRNIRLQDCFLQHQGITKKYLPKKMQQQMDFSESSSSSSESSSSSSSSSSSESSSDSEEELKTVMKPKIRSSQFLYLTKQQQQMPLREWFTMVDLEGFRPQDVTAKLNPQCRILVIKAKKDNLRQPQQMKQLEERQSFGKKFVRIIPLPENIHLEQLRVKVTTRGELVVKAPFLSRREMQQKQHLRTISSTWIPLEVTIKGKGDLFDTQRQHTKAGFKNRRCQMENEEIVTGGEVGQQECNKMKRKSFEGGLYQPHSTSTTLRTEYIRDEVTGKPVMLIKVNVIGFRSEEVRVRVVESKRVLIVEAIKQHEMPTMPQEQGLTMKYYCREFFLPEFVDVSHIAFRVLKTGVLAIKLPLLKNIKKETMLGVGQRRGEEDVEECPLLNRNKWEKIHQCA